MIDIKDLPNSYQEDIKKAVKTLKENGATEIFIFGSIVNGNLNRNSDIDIAIRGIRQEDFYKVASILMFELEKEIDEFFKLLQNKIHNEFKGYIKDIDKVIGANTSKLDIDKKIDYFNEIYKIVQANSSRPAVSKFNIAGISDGLGRKRSLPFKDKIIIVDKSVTGIYERRTCFELENGGNTKSC